MMKHQYWFKSKAKNKEFDSTLDVSLYAFFSSNSLVNWTFKSTSAGGNISKNSWLYYLSRLRLSWDEPLTKYVQNKKNLKYFLIYWNTIDFILHVPFYPCDVIVGVGLFIIVGESVTTEFFTFWRQGGIKEKKGMKSCLVMMIDIEAG